MQMETLKDVVIWQTLQQFYVNRGRRSDMARRIKAYQIFSTELYELVQKRPAENSKKGQSVSHSECNLRQSPPLWILLESLDTLNYCSNGTMSCIHVEQDSLLPFGWSRLLLSCFRGFGFHNGASHVA
jgi:hypothetical protein